MIPPSLISPPSKSLSSYRISCFLLTFSGQPHFPSSSLYWAVTAYEALPASRLSPFVKRRKRGFLSLHPAPFPARQLLGKINFLSQSQLSDSNPSFFLSFFLFMCFRPSLYQYAVLAIRCGGSLFLTQCFLFSRFVVLFQLRSRSIACSQFVPASLRLFFIPITRFSVKTPDAVASRRSRPQSISLVSLRFCSLFPQRFLYRILCNTHTDPPF